ncbi:MAG TPA: hypothetical protein VGH89_01415 [Pseudonocardia sp.]|jgi:hypothetical protein
MSESWEPGERRRATVLAVVMLGALLVPLRQNWRPKSKRRDGFPLSYYPMFSAKRRDTATIHYVVGVRADGSRRYLPHSVLGTGGLNQVRRQLNRVIREDRATDFAPVVAARIALRPELDDVARVEIIRGEVEIDASFLQRTIQAEEEMLADAEVVRLPAGGPTRTQVAEAAGVMPL